MLLHLQSHCLSIIHHFFRFSFSHFPSSSLTRSNDVNVVFDFNISLIDFAPSTPISLPVNHSSFLLFLFLIVLLPHIPDLMISMLCFFSVLHSLTLLLHLQSYCLSFIRHFVLFLVFLFFPYDSDQATSMWCSFSAFHSLILLLHLQYRFLSTIHHFFRFSFSNKFHSLLLMINSLIVVFTLRASIIIICSVLPSCVPVHCFSSCYLFISSSTVYSYHSDQVSVFPYL